MKIVPLSAAALIGLAAMAAPSFAQGVAVPPGADGTRSVNPTVGSGPASPVTGQSTSGRGGTGGAGGQLSNGTSEGAGTATGGNPGGSAKGSGAGG